jgi:glyoxylase-like metal-dependent hydrolase (beta-lactamase superfamily II)/rhodanese-related sulfurtransferase
MIFQQLVNEDAGCIAYLIGCGQAGEALVVDPGRDRVDDYVAWARRKELSLTHIVETHIHADHLSGNQALAAKTGARIHIHPASEAAYPHTPIDQGDELVIGTVRIQALHTPGHTPDSICLLVTDLSRGEEPWFVLTGDTLFVGDVGRPDFGGEGAAATLYESLRTRVLTLPDSVEVYPAHGAGSSCGRAMSSKPGSTIGFERRFNPALQAKTADDFVRALMTGLPPKPPGFDRIIAKNRSQALPSSGDPEPLSAAQVREAMAKGAVVLDARSPAEYGEGHIPGAVNVWIESNPFAARVAMMTPPDSRFVLVATGPSDLTRAVQGLGRAGMDDIEGYLQRGMTDWKSEGLPEARVPQITVHDLATMREEQPDLVVVDVREPSEWDDGHIAGAINVPMGQAIERMNEIPADRPKAVLCAGGLRSSSVISALLRSGMPGWYNVAGGMREWMKAGYPTVKSGESQSRA